MAISQNVPTQIAT